MAAATPINVRNVPQYAPISINSNGDNTVVNAVTGQTIVVLGYVLVPPNNTAVTVTFKSGASTSLSGAMPIGGANNPPHLVAPDADHGHFATAAGQALVVNLSGASLVAGHLTYMLQ